MSSSSAAEASYARDAASARPAAAAGFAETGARVSRRPVRWSGFARIAGSFTDPPHPSIRPVFDLAKATKGKVKEKVNRAKVEYFGVVRVRGDGRCMFRAMAVSLAHITNKMLTASSEEAEADQLRLAVAETMCRAPEKRKNYKDAEMAISFEMPMGTYCKRILQTSFWGGEPELLVLCHLLKRPIMVYLPAAKVRSAGTNNGYVAIQTYGSEYAVSKKSGKTRKPVRLLFNGENHYDALV
jgi:hypothetical protein